MNIKTKFGPAALLMDTSGAKMGLVKMVTITMAEGATEPTIMYTIQANDQSHQLDEKLAIGLAPMTDEKKALPAVA